MAASASWISLYRSGVGTDWRLRHVTAGRRVLDADLSPGRLAGAAAALMPGLRAGAAAALMPGRRGAAAFAPGLRAGAVAAFIPAFRAGVALEAGAFFAGTAAEAEPAIHNIAAAHQVHRVRLMPIG